MAEGDGVTLIQRLAAKVSVGPAALQQSISLGRWECLVHPSESCVHLSATSMKSLDDILMSKLVLAQLADLLLGFRGWPRFNNSWPNSYQLLVLALSDSRVVEVDICHLRIKFLQSICQTNNRINYS